jgi:hypothetical protein
MNLETQLITQLLEAAPQLAALLVLFIWHREDTTASAKEHALTINTLARLSRQLIASKEDKHG